MTELLDGIADVRFGDSGAICAVRLAGGWATVSRVANQWVVETDWWRTPVRRHYVRLLLESRGGGRRATGPGTADRRELADECVELYHDLETGVWHWSRRYD
jgi:hypothetical protein